MPAQHNFEALGILLKRNFRFGPTSYGECVRHCGLTKQAHFSFRLKEVLSIENLQSSIFSILLK